MNEQLFIENDSRERITRFLDAVLGIVGMNCVRMGIDLKSLSQVDVVADRLVPMLKSLEDGGAHLACPVGILKCATQSLIAPFVIVAKKASAEWPFNSVPNSWTCSVLVETPETSGMDYVIVRHEKRETGRPPHEYTFLWAIDFHVSRATGQVVKTRARVVEHSCRDEKIVRGLQNMFSLFK